MKLLVFLSPLAFPLATENRLGWRSNGKRRRNRERLTGFPVITLYDEEIRLTMGLSMPTLDKGIEKASYEFGTLHTVADGMTNALFSPVSRRESFLEYRERLALLNERAIGYLLSSTGY
jgi:hypothetical protein